MTYTDTHSTTTSHNCQTKDTKREQHRDDGRTEGRRRVCIAVFSKGGRNPLLPRRGLERFTATKRKRKGVIIAKNGGTQRGSCEREWFLK